MQHISCIRPELGLLLGAVVVMATLVAEGQPIAPPTSLPDWTAPEVVLYVAPDGADDAAGTREAPFRSLQQARDALRALRSSGKLGEAGAQVVVRGGLYGVAETLVLEEQDSGHEQGPIRYRAATGETPVFSGGVRLEGFTPVTDPEVLARIPESGRDHVMQTDLAVHGLKDLEPLRLGGFADGLGFTTHPVKELFFNGEAMPMSRWPNEGFVTMADVSVKDGHSIHGQEGSKVGRFIYEGDRPERWKDETAPILYGYWFFGWADSYERIASIDTDKREIVLEAPYSRYGYRAGQPYYALNMLSEIDMPGEWYLDHTTGILYFYPPTDPSESVVELSVCDVPFVEMKNVSHVTLEGLAWQLGGADAVEIDGGRDCWVAGCTIQRCGGNGIVVNGGSAHRLLACNVHTMGRGGFVVSGGDRKTLTPADHLIENCNIHTLSRIDHTYTPAVVLTGVGSRIARNLFHHIASSAVRLGGNDHLVELNEVHHVVQESDDQGGVDMWGNATYRGNVIRYNYWHHIGNQVNPEKAPPCGQAGIRLDDAISGTHVYGNVFHRTSSGTLGFGGVQIHGGKDNRIENNVFVDCMAAVSFSGWGEKRWKDFIANAMESDDIDPGLYLKRYPELKSLSEGHDVNYVTCNLAIGCDALFRRGNDQVVAKDNAVIPSDEAVTEGNSLELDKLPPLMTKHGLEPIPFEEIGVYETPLRGERRID